MAKFLLAVDAGHGKWVGGNRCMRSLDPNQTAEWVLGDRVARAIIERAKLYDGFETIRVDDPTGEDDVGLTKRCAKANAAGVDFYISLHFDAGVGGGSGGGITTFCVATGGKAECIATESIIALSMLVVSVAIEPILCKPQIILFCEKLLPPLF